MAAYTNKHWRQLKIGCIGVSAVVGVAVIVIGAIAWKLWHMTPGEGTPGTDAFEQWLADNRPLADAENSAIDELEKADSIYSETNSKFLLEKGTQERPSDWPGDSDVPLSFEMVAQRGCPDVVRATTIELMERLRLGGLDNALARVSKIPATPITLYRHRVGPQAMDIELAKYNSARIAEGVRNGNEPEVVAAFAASMAISNLADCRPTMASQTIAIAIAKLATNDLRIAMLEMRLSDPALAECQRILQNRSRLTPIDVGLRSYRAMMLDAIERGYSDEPNGEGRLFLQFTGDPSDADSLSLDLLIPEWLRRFDETPIVNIVGFLYPTKKEAVTRLDAICDEFHEHAKTPVWQRNIQSPPQLQGKDRERFPFLLNTDFLPQAIAYRTVHQANVEGSSLMLAIERFRATRNALPKSLEDLAPDFIAAVPMDPWTGTSFGYKLLPSPDEHGREYILYSYGSNLIDDGGVYEDFQAFNESEKARNTPSDFIFNTPRPVYAPPE